MRWSIIWNMLLKFNLRGTVCSIGPLENVTCLWMWKYPSGNPHFTLVSVTFFSLLTLGHIGKFITQILSNFCNCLEFHPVLTYLQFPQRCRTYPSEALHFFFSKTFIPLTSLSSPKPSQPALIVWPKYKWVAHFSLHYNWALCYHWFHTSGFLISLSHSKENSRQSGQTGWWLNSSSYWPDLMLTFRKNIFLLSLRNLNRGVDCLFKGIIKCMS